MDVLGTNRRARQKYQEFIGVLATVWMVLDESRKVIDRMDDGVRPSWRASHDDVVSARRRALEQVDELQARARRYEAELVSRDWRL